MAYRSAFGLSTVPEAGEDYGLLLSVQTKPVAIGSRLVSEAKSGRYFRAWASLTSRKSLYVIIKTGWTTWQCLLNRTAAAPRQRNCVTSRRTGCTTPSPRR